MHYKAPTFHASNPPGGLALQDTRDKEATLLSLWWAPLPPIPCWLVVSSSWAGGECSSHQITPHLSAWSFHSNSSSSQVDRAQALSAWVAPAPAKPVCSHPCLAGKEGLWGEGSTLTQSPRQEIQDGFLQDHPGKKWWYRIRVWAPTSSSQPQASTTKAKARLRTAASC